MARRSYSDVPNRIVRLFLQEAGRHYDENRGLTPYSSMTEDLKQRFGNACAYCGAQDPTKLVEEHLVPINRASAGLHSWGNVVPACRECNKKKSDHAWEQHPELNDARREAIRAYIAEYQYAPDVAELLMVLDKLYDLADRQTRSLVEFGLVASKPYIAALYNAKG
jgi:hypothetical protein